MTPAASNGSSSPSNPLVAVVDFHHARGPEIELWLGAKDGTDPAVENDWSLLPFMALSDGAHATTEDFSYFTLRRAATSSLPASSLFGISCTRQLPSSELLNRPPEVTRSTVQKAVVVVTDEPQHFGMLREKLSMVTAAWFSQRDFSDVDILKKFQESLSRSLQNDDGQRDQYFGLSLREMIHEFKHQTLVLFKCCLLQPKMLFFGSRCERLCMIQFSLLSLIPGLIRALQDCADPAFDSYAKTVAKPTSLKTSERSSLLAYMGLPLQIFGKGSFFGPYTPLQQLDMLADHGTKSYIVGSTNSLLLQQRDRYSDILINLDEDTISITSPSLRSALALSAADRRWIDFLVQTVNETWDEANPSRPNTMGYMGSEEFIRLQFEEYLLALLSSEKYHHQLGSESSQRHRSPSPHQKPTSPPPPQHPPENDPSRDFSDEFLSHWRQTSNYALFSSLTSDALLFSIVEPRHPCAGGLNIDDIQRRLAQQVAELHLDERVREGREVLNKHLATGQKKVSTAFNNLWADIEAMREAQRKKADEKSASASTSTLDGTVESTSSPTSASASYSYPWSQRKVPAVDLTQAQASVSTAGQKAGAYISSWGAWASDRRKEWAEKRASSAVSSPTVASPSSPPGSTFFAAPEEKERGRVSAWTGGKNEDSVASGSSNAGKFKRWSSALRRKDVSAEQEEGSGGLEEDETGGGSGSGREKEKDRHSREENRGRSSVSEVITATASSASMTEKEKENVEPEYDGTAISAAGAGAGSSNSVKTVEEEEGNDAASASDEENRDQLPPTTTTTS